MKQFQPTMAAVLERESWYLRPVESKA